MEGKGQTRENNKGIEQYTRENKNDIGFDLG
jgi:hypothetical protein